MKLQSLNPHRPLSARQIFWRFAQDTMLTGAIYILLVLATLTLRYFAALMKDSPLHHGVLEFLEHAIFLCGTAVALLVLIGVTIVAVMDLGRSFHISLGAPAVSDQPADEEREKWESAPNTGLKRTPDGAA